MSIPEIKWKERKSHIRVRTFRIICEDELKSVLVHTLSRLPLSDEGTALHLLLDASACDDESFCVESGADGVVVRSRQPKGIHYALNILSQLVFSDELYEGCFEMTPAFRSRGLMLDVSRGKMASLSYIMELIDFISSLSMNVLQLYMEDKHRLSSYPEAGSLYGAYTEDEIRQIDEYAKARFIELQPNIQTFSHMHGILRFPCFSHMAENDTLFSLCAVDDDVLTFLDKEFEEVLPWYSSKTVNINMDEAYDLGSVRSRQTVEEKGKAEVFFSYLDKVISLARRHGAEKIQIWGDAVLKYPEYASNLPDYVTVIDWNYNPADSYESISAYPGVVKNYWAAPGVSSWNSIFPRVYNSMKNIRNYSRDAFDASAQGYLVTDWGDYGHYQMHGLSLFSYMYAAECAFNIHRQDNSVQFWSQACRFFFPDEHVCAAFRYLMDSNEAENIQTGFKSMSIYAFFDDMFTGLSMKGNDKYPKVSLDAFKTLKDLGGKACGELEKTGNSASYWPSVTGQTFIDELRLAAKMSEYTGDKGILSYRITGEFENGTVNEEKLLGFIIDIKRLFRRFTDIMLEFVRLWKLRAKEDGMEATLFIFEKAAVQLSKAAVFLAREREKLIAGLPVCMSDYHDGDGYEVLWTSDFRNMWDRAYPWQ